MAPRDLWSQADIDVLVQKREVEKKKFSEIALEMGRPEGSCWRRYTQIVAAREPAPSIVPEPRPRRVPFHRQLGIETYTHMQAVLWDPAGRLGNKRRMTDLHTYRMPITLAKVFHEAS
jgi:hypothetical protein